MVDFTKTQVFPIPSTIIELNNKNQMLKNKNLFMRNFIIGALIGCGLIVGYQFYLFKKEENEQ